MKKNFLNLTKDICFFDFECTGLSVAKDRVIQIAIIKIFADGSPTIEKCRLINPGMPIPKESTEIHGITDEMVKNEPTFEKIAKGLFDLIGDADFGGFNSNRYDVPMLIEEFSRCGLTLDMTNRKTIDVWKIFQKMEPRNLKAAYKFYCGKDLEKAHDALEDTKATIEVLFSQIEKYKGVDCEDSKGDIIVAPVKNDIQSLHDFTNEPNRVDFMGKLIKNSEGNVVFTFGKYNEQPVAETLYKDPGYYKFLMGGDFAIDTKNKITELLNEYKLKKQSITNEA